MPLKKLVVAALAATTSLMAAVDKNQSTPYDLIRPVWPLTWDTTAFDNFDTNVTVKHNMVPKNRKPAAFAPNEYIPDTLNQAYWDNINTHISPIRINQAGYLERDPEKQFYYVGKATTFEVVDVNGNSLSPKVTGTFSSSKGETESSWVIVGGTNAATNDKQRYRVEFNGQEGSVLVGNIPSAGLTPETRYRIKVGNDISSTFIISDRVYSMVRNASIKFFGINRSGDSESWFHPASHTLDGGAPSDSGKYGFDESLAGSLAGGYYDCGDHLKESQTQMYAFMVAAVMAATNPDADEDVYAYNHNEALNTDGIPDMLREAKHGGDFVLRSYRRAKGVIDDMALSVGDFGSDHGWWGRPESQDKLPLDPSKGDPALRRGGPLSRTVRLGEIGSNIGGETVAGLAILSKDYQVFDPAFADSCLMVAEKMYDFAKNLAQGKSSYDGGKPFVHNKKAAGWNTPAYNGNNEFVDDMALASVALLYATGKKEYADDALRNKNMYPGQQFHDTPADQAPGFFRGGWFVTNDKGFFKNGKNTSWANAYAFATYALYKLILQDKNKAITEYGLDETEWLNAVEDCISSMISNLGESSNETFTGAIELPKSGNWKDKYGGIKYDPMWYAMKTDQEWIYNRYQAGNIFEVLAYADVANDIKTKGLVLPNMGSPDWKADEMYQLGINQLNYLLGVNPWDISFILGIGDKNDAHPHHRAANPEGKNMPGANYKYNPPVGALYGSVVPGKMVNGRMNGLGKFGMSTMINGTKNMIIAEKMSWEDYEISETCIDAAASLVSTGMLAAQKIDRKERPKVSVEIRHVSMDSAIVMVKLSKRGFAQLSYGTDEKSMTTAAAPDSNIAGMQHEIILRGLEKGTTYYFYATGTNAYAADSITTKYMVDSTQTPFSFTTLNAVESAQIANITVCNMFGDTAEVMWYTPNGEYESKIYWDTVPHAKASEFAFNSGNGNADISGIPTKFHYVKIGGLKEQTTYYYMVESNGVQQNVDDNGKILKFTTPVGWYDFSVRTYQYEFSGLDFLNINIYNNESRAFDSLELRMYFTAVPEDVEKCALLIDIDIPQAYDEAGFNHPLLDKYGNDVQTETRALMRNARPVRLDDTYNAATGEYDYYFPVPLGGTEMKSSSRIRLDFAFSYGISNDGYQTCETLRQRPRKRMSATSGDWSWRPHKFQVDGADYDGMPAEEKEYGDFDVDIPINPYITVYRKNEFIWGYSPSSQEMSTKKAHYEMEVTYDAPFNVSDGSYVQIDQTSSVVHVTGHAYVSEGGYITKVWTNGQLLDAELREIEGERYLVSPTYGMVAHYNSKGEENDQDSLGLWTLDIPVKMGIGSNKIDITLFAGADPNNPECAENGGCAFVNRTYYVQFTRGNATASALTIKGEAGNSVDSPADPKGTSFYIYLTDKDKANYKGTLNVKVLNRKKQDSLMVKMVEDAANPGSFKSANLITALNVSKNSRDKDKQISFFAGDTIQVIYLDPDDPEDESRQSFFAEATTPLPEKILAQDSDCDNTADKLSIQFSNALNAAICSFDSIRIFIEGMRDSVTLAVDQASAKDKDVVVIDLPASLGIPENASPTGKATLFMTAEGEVSYTEFNISDGIPPRLQSVTILENPDRKEDSYDIVMISFTEPVQQIKAWPLSVTGLDGAAVPQTSIQVIETPSTDNDGKSYMFTIAGNSKGEILPVGGEAAISSTVQIADFGFNQLVPKNNCKQVFIAETPKPVPVNLAEMRDLEGDGYPDEIYIRFEKKLRPKDVLDSFVVEWGFNSETRSFITKADTSTHQIVPVDNSWSIQDSIGEPYEIMIDSVTSIVRDTFSIVTINIPTTNSFTQGATTGAYDGYGRITPRLGPEGGFFDTRYPVSDKCPPVVVSATWKSAEIKGKQTDILEVIVSEPLDTVAHNTDYFERLRDGSAGTYYSPRTNAAHSIYKSSTRGYTLTYSHDASGAFWLTDSIRLVPVAERSYLKDKVGLIAGAGTPWVPIVGRITKAKFKVDVLEPITAVNKENIYGGLPLLPNEHFRLSVKNKEGATIVVASGSNKLQNVASAPIPNYEHAGPVFKIEVTMPEVLATTQLGEAKRAYEVAIAVDFYSNIGSFVNSTTYKFNPADFTDYISAANSSITFYLEWCAPKDYPLSAEGRKIATGPYIAKFNAKAKGKYVATVPDEGDNQKSFNANETLTKTFGFRRSKK
ncbi:MAG: glycoside hydrolase family 9 protein [Fibrobacter sp.]|nr:glycoside hydrolase family 9 protein [Fibrobacter sp.]